MHQLPIKKNKVEEIIEISEVTRKIDGLETKSGFEFSELLKRIKKAAYGIPEYSTALYNTVEDLNDDEKIALLFIVQIGRDLIPKDEKYEEMTKAFFTNPDVSAAEVAPYIIDLIDLPVYLQKGLEELDEMVK